MANDASEANRRLFGKASFLTLFWTGSLALLGLGFIHTAQNVLYTQRTIDFEVHAAYRIDGDRYEGHGVWRATLLWSELSNGTTEQNVQGEAILLGKRGPTSYYMLRADAGYASSSLSYGAWPIHCGSAEAKSNKEAIVSIDRKFLDRCAVPEQVNPIVVAVEQAKTPVTVTVLNQTPNASGRCDQFCREDLFIVRSHDDITTGIVDHLSWLAAYTSGFEDISDHVFVRHRSDLTPTLHLVDFSTNLRENLTN